MNIFSAFIISASIFFFMYDKKDAATSAGFQTFSEKFYEQFIPDNLQMITFATEEPAASVQKPDSSQTGKSYSYLYVGLGALVVFFVLVIGFLVRSAGVLSDEFKKTPQQ